MATSARKHTVPAAGETPRRQAINDLAASINDIVPVQNQTARAQLLADVVAAGHVWPRPLYVDRADAGPRGIIERTIDGTTWEALAGVTAPALLPLVASDWSHRDGRGVQWYQDGPDIVIQGSFVSRNAGVTSTSLFAVGTLPPEARPGRVESSVGMAVDGTILGLVEIYPNGEVVAKIATPTANLPAGQFNFVINTRYRRAT